jgi:hypothetical protein
MSKTKTTMERPQGVVMNASFPRALNIPTDPTDPDAGLWRLVGLLVTATAAEDAASSAKYQRVADELEVTAAANAIVGEIEQAIWALPAKTPQGLMIKMAIAYEHVMEQPLPAAPFDVGYFSLHPDDGGDYIGKRSFNALWQNAVDMFGKPPLLYPGYRSLGDRA